MLPTCVLTVASATYSALAISAFVAPVLRSALDAAGDATDCASLVEARGGRVTVVPGDERLLKVTTPADLELVASWL